MTNVYGSAKNIPSFLLLLCHLTIDRANNRSFPISSQLNRSEVLTFSPRVGQKFCCRVPIKSPYSPTSARVPPPPFGEADDKCITVIAIVIVIVIVIAIVVVIIIIIKITISSIVIGLKNSYFSTNSLAKLLLNSLLLDTLLLDSLLSDRSIGQSHSKL